jgi:hypothetical protein
MLILIGIIWFAPGGFRLLLLPVGWVMGLVRAVVGSV